MQQMIFQYGRELVLIHRILIGFEAILEIYLTLSSVRERTTGLVSILQTLTMVEHILWVPVLFNTHQLANIISPVQFLPVNV